MSTVKKSPSTQRRSSEQRRAAAAAQMAQARRVEQRRRLLTVGGVAAASLVVVAVVIAIAARGGNDASPPDPGAAPVVGGDLHTVLSVENALYVGGHARSAVSRNDGKTWRDIASLEGADAMGWAVFKGTLLAGGHPGLYRSTDRGLTFEKLTGSSAVPDVHALGGAGGVLYLASPQSGFMASTDGGNTWETRNADMGQSFMGTILVDPGNTERLIAPDMASGLQSSSDGGRSWRSLGGPMGAMAASWNPTNTNEILAVGMQGAERSTDGGATWGAVQVPAGTSAVTYAPDGQALYAGVLEGERAVVYRSTDDGESWTATA